MQPKGTVEKLETGMGVILSEAKNLNTAQADSSVAEFSPPEAGLPQNDKVGFFNTP